MRRPAKSLKFENQEEIEKSLSQWEPQMHKMLQKFRISSGEYEDALQELRIGLLKAKRNFDEQRGVKFHTYLYRVFCIEMMRFIDKSKSHTETELIYDIAPEEDNNEAEMFEELVTTNLKLHTGHRILLDLIMCGYHKKDIYAMAENKEEIKIIFKQLQEFSRI